MRAELLDRPEDVRMRPEDDGRARTERCGGQARLPAIGPGVQLDAPVEPDDDEIGLPMCGADVGRDRGRIRPRAVPADAGPAAKPGGLMSEYPRKAILSPPASRNAGRRAAASSAPPPTVAIPAACAAASVSASPTAPKSSEWLFATVTTSRPANARAPASTAAGPRKRYCLAASTPRLVTAPSRFAVVMSALRSVAPTNAQGYAPPCAATAGPTCSPGVTSPTAASVRGRTISVPTACRPLPARTLI